MAVHAHTTFKVKINVTVCQTINELTDWQGKFEVTLRRLMSYKRISLFQAIYGPVER